jgi:AcrR family transcriptional regulator
MNEKTYHHGNLRNQLIETGIKLINEDGLKGFSLRKVAMNCGVSHTAPYSHFKDIDELISAMGEYITVRFMDKLNSSLQGVEDSQEAVLCLGKAYIDFFSENREYFQVLFYHSGISIDLNQENASDYPPYALFRATAYKLFRSSNMPEEVFSKRLAELWSVVHGIASLLTNSGIRYNGNWKEVFIGVIGLEEGENK